MKVTDLDFYLDNDLKEYCDLLMKRTEKKWDNLIILDGEERSGKTTLAKAMCYYMAHKQGKKFGLRNVFFNPENMSKFARENEREIILWDEAAFGGLASMWQSKIQQMLVMMLMAAGKYKHTYIFIIPSFFKLKNYLALHRSSSLIHVYSPDMLSRGLFICYNRTQKTWIYNNYKKSQTYGKQFSFRGRFVVKNIENAIWNEEDYEKKKDEAIESIKKWFDKKKTQKSPLKLQFDALKHKIATKLDVAEASDLADVSIQTIYQWKKLENGGVS